MCQPICEPPCEMGVCTEPNVCDSEQGMSSTESYKEHIEFLEKSIDGSPGAGDLNDINVDDYEEKDTHISKELVEITTPRIVSSTPELPSPSPSNPCFEGFALDSNGLCRLQCEIDCHYGTYQNGKCICTKGFLNSPVNHCICEPHCDNECYNGLCTGNNTCLCDEGYKLNPEDNFICLNSTTCHCINGDCTDADHCSCWSGYKLEYSERNYHRCEPLCGDPNNPEGCVNGKCVAPFLCQCNEGFIHGPANNFTCYADMNCVKCIKNKLNCLPGCYTTTTTLSTETQKDVEETSTSIYDYYDFSTTMEDHVDQSAPM